VRATLTHGAEVFRFDFTQALVNATADSVFALPKPVEELAKRAR